MLHNLRRLREEHHTTQRQLAEAIGVSQQSVNKYENQNIEPDIHTLIRIADYFGTTVDYLIGRTNECETVSLTDNPMLSSAEIDLIKRFRSLTPKQKKCVETVLESYQ